MRDIANLALIALTVLTVTFTILYVSRSPWDKNEIGRIYAAKSTIIALVMIQITASVMISTEYPGRHIIRFIIYGLGAAAMVPMILSLLAHQRADRKKLKGRRFRK